MRFLLRSPLVLLADAAALALFASCSSYIPALKMIWQGGEKQLRPPPRIQTAGPRVLIFALDGAGYDQVLSAVRSGKASNLANLIGKDSGGGVHDHGYFSPNAYAIYPTITIAAWSSIFTGAPPAYDGIPGDEWFERDRMKFVAPIPISVPDKSDTLKMIASDLVGEHLKAPTVYEQARVSCGDSMNAVYRGVNVYSTVEPSAILAMFGDFLAGRLDGQPATADIFANIDRDSIPKLIDAMNTHGVPALQTVYFPGIDLYTHVAPGDPLAEQSHYLETVTDPLIGKVLHAYEVYGVLNNTYVIVVSDHGHTPVLNNLRHALGIPPDAPSQVLRESGFRTRPFVLEPSANEQDYQAVLAYEDATAFVYLADRSRCPKPGDKCDWKRPPRFKEDVLAVARAFFRANRTGYGAPRLKGTLDLILARMPSSEGKPAREFEVFNGHKLIPIFEYLEHHPRPDLPDLDRRMRWLSEGPYGDRAGDILLLARSGLNRELQDRFYFAPFYHSVHGSASVQDTHVPLILAHQGCSGAALKKLMDSVAGPRPSHLDITPLILAILAQNPEHNVCTPAATASPTPIVPQ